METTNKIILNGSINKVSADVNESLNITLSGNKKLLPEDTISEFIDPYGIYLEERKNSNKFRLVVNLNPYCTNILFNPFTEIVKDEGSDDAILLNYETDYKSEKVIGKNSSFVWNQYEAIRDTQLSNDICGFDYHCGFDIFNNHILRNKAVKSVNYSDNYSNNKIGYLSRVYGSPYVNVKVNYQGNAHVYNGNIYNDSETSVIGSNFNTIDDYMRDRNGVIISEQFPKYVKENVATNNENLDMVIMPLHLYQDYDIRTFMECYEEKLVEENGWLGFRNPSILSTMSLWYNKNAEINKAINNKKDDEFIDMYPGRDLYSFQPKYNPYRKRLEKNWNYCLTYPSESLTNGDFPFFRIDASGNTALKVLMFDEYTIDDSGVNVLTIYSISKHGLMEGDRINIYKTDDLFYESVEVLHVIDNYIFQVKKDTANMSSAWVALSDRIMSPTYTYNGKEYPVCASQRCNVDDEAQDISFRRVVNDIECKYYVRKFSRLPNFKFRNAEINDYTLYDDEYIKKNGSLIREFSNPSDEKCDFENHIAKLGFAKTSYGDDVAEIVYTDDIDTSHLKDNLGRPLSEIYLTIVKNNKGYKEWYGIESNIDIKTTEIEYSHCFGKVNCSFLLSDYYRNANQGGLKDVRDITAGDDSMGLINLNNTEIATDEIDFYNDYDFYGDICCYSPVDCDEQVIQTAMYRFNTAQRELSYYNAQSEQNFYNGVLTYDEINENDVESNLLWERIKWNNDNSYEGDPFLNYNAGAANPKSKDEIDPTADKYIFYHTTRETLKEGNGNANVLASREGYFYQPHYRIPIKTISSSLSYDPADKYTIYEIVNTEAEKDGITIFEIKTVESNVFSKNEKLVLYKKSVNKYFFVTVDTIISSNDFMCVIADEAGNHLDNIENLGEEESIRDYSLLRRNPGTPDYARLMKDGSCRYCWRDVVSNGLEDEDKVYPFTNGAFYITKQINFFLRRQDPYRENLGAVGGLSKYTSKGQIITDYYDDLEELEHYESEEIEQC